MAAVLSQHVAGDFRQRQSTHCLPHGDHHVGLLQQRRKPDPLRSAEQEIWRRF